MVVGIFDKVDTEVFVAMLSRAKRRFGFVVMMFNIRYVCWMCTMMVVYEDDVLGKAVHIVFGPKN